MRPTYPILFGVLSCGLAAGLLIARLAESPAAPAQEQALTPTSSAPATSDTASDQRSAAALDELNLELATLRARVERLERPDSREAALIESPENESTEVNEGLIPTSEERAKILAVMAQLEEEQRHDRALQRAAKQEAEYQRRATRLANKLELPTGSEERIASILMAESEKVALVREQYKGLGRGPEARQALKQALAETRRWRDDELTSYFGAEVAKQISAEGSSQKRERKFTLTNDKQAKKSKGK